MASVRIHPLRTASSLSDAEIAVLYRSIRQVLRRPIAYQGTDAGDGVIEGDYMPRVYGREGKPCYRYHQPLHKIVVAQLRDARLPALSAEATPRIQVRA